MRKKSVFFILLAFSMFLLFQSQTEIVRADQQSSYYDITLTSNDTGGRSSNDNSGGTIANHSENGNEVTNGDNGGDNQVTKAPGTTAIQAKSQPNILTGLLPQTSNEQEGLLLGVLILIIMLLGWIIYLLIEGKRGRDSDEKFN
ncbi:hypothetical protein [Companilactobacillus sp. HBUAS59699]|uniref:hypothetical protein n=1 Tax=Companilactobacillus sp. HBUAS59699 TaxID=3109358 RepID=UPI002FEEDE10